MVLEQLNEGAPFASVAADFSTCPSKSQGGSLGGFSPGTMVGEFCNKRIKIDRPICLILKQNRTYPSYSLTSSLDS